MWYKLMDPSKYNFDAYYKILSDRNDSLIIYSSVFLLVSFVVLNKYVVKDILKSLAIPVLLLISYFVLVEESKGGVVDNGMELLTEMPNF
jgi:hypothetical protein